MVDYLVYRVTSDKSSSVGEPEHFELIAGRSRVALQGRGLATLAEKWASKSKEMLDLEMRRDSDALTTIPAPILRQNSQEAIIVQHPLSAEQLVELFSAYVSAYQRLHPK